MEARQDISQSCKAILPSSSSTPFGQSREQASTILSPKPHFASPKATLGPHDSRP